MSGGNTPGAGTPDPKEAREPPDFASHPQEAYDFVCYVLEESIAAKEKYKAKYAGTNAPNRKLHSIVHEKIEQIEALESETASWVIGTSPPQRFRPIMALREAPQLSFGSTTWRSSRESTSGLMIRHWKLDSWLYQGLLVPGESTKRRMISPPILTLTFKAALLDRFSVQTSTVENVKAMADLRQGPTD